MSASTSHKDSSPWHPGEVEMQKTVGVVERMDVVGRRVIRPYMPDQHRLFYSQLPFIIMGVVDEKRDVWATIRTGRPGFVISPDPARLLILAEHDSGDPSDGGLVDGAAVGLLGIEPETRRRNRVNGHIHALERGFELTVEESFGNCPRYIRPRALQFSEDGLSADRRAASKEHFAIDAPSASLIGQADHFFVASYVEDTDGVRRVDVSHRGGSAGFVRLEADGALTIPDYAGNLFFNTLGNFVINPRAGLLFIDWTSGDLFQMTGRTEMVSDPSQIESFAGAERLWRFFPARVFYRAGVLPVREDKLS